MLGELEALETRAARGTGLRPGLLGDHGALHVSRIRLGGRFTDSTFGAFYAARSLGTAIAETRYHREVFLRATQEAPIELTMRSYCADVGAKFHDLRGQRAQLPAIYDPDSYVTSQVLGRELRDRGLERRRLRQRARS